MLKLNNNVEMPQFGLGTFLMKEGEETYNAVLSAIKCGYKKIDTAHAYQNERSVGKAILDSKINRQDIWITSKLWVNEYGKDKTLNAIDKMLKRLNIDYIDLVYFHQAVGNYLEGWEEMEKALELGKVRSIGISNFDANDEIFNSFINSVKVKPQIMQLECHPYAQRKHWQEVLKEHNIVMECWYPLGGGDNKKKILNDPILVKIAQNHNKSVVQIVIRWHIQKGFSVIPKSSQPDHIKENINVFDFELSQDEMKKIESLDKESRFFNMSYDQQQKMFTSWKVED